MNKSLFKDANEIINYSINEVLPDKTIRTYFNNFNKPKGKTIMIAIGKAAFTMARETVSIISVDKGLVVTKYDHSKGSIPNTEIIEAGHPTPDSNSIKAAQKAIGLCSNLTSDDTVLMLISGGGSSLFELPIIDLKELQEINNELVKSGASINEINIIRKRLSKVKGGKFAEICKPAKVINIILSDIINNPLDMIASGPTYIDSSTSKEALKIIDKYKIDIKENIKELLKNESVKDLNNIETHIIGSNEDLRKAAKQKAITLGYKVVDIDKPITSDINDAVSLFKEKIDQYKDCKENICIIAGGEITVKINGDGLGGRNQEFACRMSKYITDNNICFFAIGSDGTDGPTDVAGGYVDKDTFNNELDYYLIKNDTYHFLEKYGGHIKTGPTGSNVCDLYCLLIKNNSI